MNEPAQDPLETILRLCAAAAPGAWYPRPYARKHNIDPATMDGFLEELWLEGLIAKADRDPEAGPGIALSERGREVLEDPEALERLREGRPLVEGDRGGIVRQVLRTPVRPTVTKLLVLANLAVFGYGWYLAQQRAIGQPYVKGFDLFGKGMLDVRVYGTWLACGAITRPEYLGGQWWRLLTAEWVHGGLPHLLLNMLGLYLVGRLTEAMWGHLRYLALYLVSAWASVCVGLATQPDLQGPGLWPPVLGASGGVCGLMGAEAVWVLCNGRHLPRALRRRARAGMVMNLVLLCVIGFSSVASGWGHFGGIAAGTAGALLFQVQRFGPPALRAPAAAAVVLVPAVAFGVLEYTFADEKFEWRYLGRTTALTREAEQLYQKEVEPVLEMNWQRREPGVVEALLPRLDQMRSQLAELAAGLEKVGPRRHPETEEARQAARDFVAAEAERYALIARCLREREKWMHKDEKALHEQAARVAQKRQAWRDLLAP
jgi:membrane associated rhomboid family serine protease